MRHIAFVLFLLVMPTLASSVQAAEPPWGRAASTERDYAPQKVVYDVATSSMSAFENVLDRASYLSQLYNANPFEASIVLVLHGNEIDYFAVENFDKHKELMRRAQSLTVGGVIEIRMCELAAQGRGYESKDIHGFVNMVPMADAEIIRLQQVKGHVYMR